VSTTDQSHCRRDIRRKKLFAPTPVILSNRTGDELAAKGIRVSAISPEERECSEINAGSFKTAGVFPRHASALKVREGASN